MEDNLRENSDSESVASERPASQPSRALLLLGGLSLVGAMLTIAGLIGWANRATAPAAAAPSVAANTGATSKNMSESSPPVSSFELSMATDTRESAAPLTKAVATPTRGGATPTRQSFIPSENACFVDTGGTCAIMGCDWSRGKTTCVNKVCMCQTGYCVEHGKCVAAGAHTGRYSDYDAGCFGKSGSDNCGKKSVAGDCVCDDGCMGSDGNCHSHSNRMVASDFTLRNVKWPDQTMYVQSMALFNQLKTTSYSSSSNQGQDKFALLELPGAADGQKEYFIASQKWPEYVIAMASTTGTSVSLFGGYAASLQSNHEPWALENMVLKVCSVKGQADTIQIGTSVPTGGSPIWAYIKEMTWFVYGYWLPERMFIAKILGEKVPSIVEGNDPGPGGYWKPEPPFPKGLLKTC